MPLKQPSKAGLYCRAAIFWLASILMLVFVVLGMMLLLPAPLNIRYHFATIWGRSNVWLLRVVCGLDFQVKGAENLPKGAAIAMVKHQSTWETYALQQILPAQAWVLKRELLWVPLFGWGLKMLNPIALDRRAGRKAVSQLVRQGEQRLANGRWVIIFPEGTRTPPGRKGDYKIGGAILASRVDYPVVPVAHNAGEFWPRHSFIKWPGKISVVIGAPIYGKGRKPEEVNQEVAEWIEGEMEKISNPSLWNR